MASPDLPPSPGSGGRRWLDHVGDLADRLGTSVAVLVGGAVAAVLGVVVALFLWARDTPPPPELTLPRATPDASVTTGSTAPSTVMAHAAGAVVRPGVYTLGPGDRVGDLLAAAGGPTDGADLDRVNLAAPLTDGSRVYVPEVGQQQTPTVLGPDVGGAAAAGAGEPGGPRVNLNTADAAALEELPGIGPATASAILAHRDESGPFASVDDLIDVRGIGDAKLAALRDLVEV